MTSHENKSSCLQSKSLNKPRLTVCVLVICKVLITVKIKLYEMVLKNVNMCIQFMSHL